MGRGARIGIIGGTFDPVHYGHLASAEQACHQFDLDQVIFVPAAHPPHKVDQDITHPEHRYRMVLLATVDNPRFRVSRVELDRPGPSYTVDTLEILHKTAGGGRFFFISGMDAVVMLDRWKAPDRLLELTEFIALRRPGFPLVRYYSFLNQLPPERRARFHRLNAPQLDISSTGLRRRLRQNEPVSYLMPEPVIRYSERYQIYTGGKGSESSRLT